MAQWEIISTPVAWLQYWTDTSPSSSGSHWAAMCSLNSVSHFFSVLSYHKWNKFPRLAFSLYKTSMASARLGISFFSLQILSLSQFSGVCDSRQLRVSPQLAAVTGKSNSTFCPQEPKPPRSGTGVSRTVTHSASSTLRPGFRQRASHHPGHGPPTLPQQFLAPSEKFTSLASNRYLEFLPGNRNSPFQPLLLNANNLWVGMQLAIM